MAKSIMQQGDPRCFLCGRRVELERHHVFGGVANRPLSEKYGLWVYLCHNCHTGKDGAQYNREKGDKLKRLAQIAFEARHSREEWMRVFRKNYLRKEGESNDETEGNRTDVQGCQDFD